MCIYFQLYLSFFLDMGTQHNTHVSNGLEVEVKVTVTHPNLRSDLLYIQPNKTRNVPTNPGTVTISVFEPNSQNKNPCESINLPSDHSVVVRKSASGKPKLCRVKYGSLWKDVGDAENL